MHGVVCNQRQENLRAKPALDLSQHAPPSLCVNTTCQANPKPPLIIDFLNKNINMKMGCRWHEVCCQLSTSTTETRSSISTWNDYPQIIFFFFLLSFLNKLQIVYHSHFRGQPILTHGFQLPHNLNEKWIVF